MEDYESRIAALEAKLATPDREQQLLTALAAWVNKQTDHFAPSHAYSDLQGQGFGREEIVTCLRKLYEDGKLKHSRALILDGERHYLRTEKWDL